MDKLTGNRCNWIDWAKTVGIMFVIFGHIPMNIDNLPKEVICSFHMPLFFAISGYLHKGTSSFKSSLKKYLHTLIIPYLFFNVIFYPYWLLQQSSKGVNVMTLSDGIIKPVIGILIGQQIGKGNNYLDLPSIINGVTWFIVTLFIIKITIDYFLRSKQKNYLVIFFSIFCIILGLIINTSGYPTTFTFQCVLKDLPFFVGGYLLKEYKIFEKITKSSSFVIFIVLISLIIWLQKFNISIDPYQSFNAMLIYYLIGTTGIFMTLNFCRLLDNIHFHFVNIISVGNIVILGIHWMFIGTINYILKYFGHIRGEINYTTLEAVLLTCAITLMSYPIIIFMRKYLSIFIGKR